MNASAVVLTDGCAGAESQEVKVQHFPQELIKHGSRCFSG